MKFIQTRTANRKQATQSTSVSPFQIVRGNNYANTRLYFFSHLPHDDRWIIKRKINFVSFCVSEVVWWVVFTQFCLRFDLISNESAKKNHFFPSVLFGTFLYHWDHLSSLLLIIELTTWLVLKQAWRCVVVRSHLYWSLFRIRIERSVKLGQWKVIKKRVTMTYPSPSILIAESAKTRRTKPTVVFSLQSIPMRHDSSIVLVKVLTSTFVSSTVARHCESNQ